MAQGSSEPSMEEILSSIKRIIAEDTIAPPARTPRFADTEAEPASEPDVLELTQPVALPPAFEPAPVEPVTVPTREELISNTTADASRAALAALSRLVVKPDAPGADPTLEGLVREMLRPMLKDWLDAHLPGIVAAAVQREVSRIGGRLP